ncbi:hypothetical protein HLB44_04040 [Aquincola sp. S2]|uniref:Pilus assembly protein PilX n=1 Tax=Pseudaquabacterium terrae TaxID=2732868 RepID=A0ABX2EDF4_9BURK|nr:hypothetical protein [Aquabacterium terrae]NRF66145.1 hypothetical protein [Aquabacterium terrae]
MKHSTFSSQRGVTMLMVLLLMSAMLLGALAFARITEAGALVSGNVATKEASLHAAEVGRAAAYAQLVALVDKTADTGGWYWATMQPTTATNVPSTINFDGGTPVVAGGVGRFTVTYAVDRLCNVNVVNDSARECLVMVQPPDATSGDPQDKTYNPKDYKAKGPHQYRITVRVTDARGTQTWTQSLTTVN